MPVIHREKTLSATVTTPERPKARACLLALPLLVGGAEQSLAQQAGAQGLEEIIVTASRREEDLQSIATSIAAMTGADLDKQGITGFREMAEVVSGLELKQSRGLASSAVYIRGVGGDSGATDPSVGVVIDGVYQASIGAAFTELLDIERVEILRGPQGTLFGKNTTAGVIRVFTADPDTREFSGRVQAVGGNLDNRELRGLINIPIVEEKVGARLSAYTAQRDGHTKNLYVGEDTRNVDREGWRAKLLWNATDTIDIKFSAETHNQNSRMDSALVEYPANLLEQYRDILPPISIGNYQQSAEETKEDISRYVLSGNWNLASHTLSLISSRENIESFFTSDRDHTVLEAELGSSTLTALTNDVKRKVTTHELQLASSFEQPIDYILGAFWQTDDLASTNDLYYGDGNLVPRPPTEWKITSRAVFGNLTYDFNESWGGSFGARYTEDEKMGSNNIVDGEVTFEEWTYSFKIRYQMDPDRMVYFSHDKGFKSGGINRDFSGCGRGGPCLTAEQALWDPVTTFNYELGVKSEWLDNRLRVNAALFYQIYKDFQVSQTIPGEASVLFTNASEVKSTGLEADFVWVPTDSLTISGNMAYMKTRYEEYENAPCALPTSPHCVDGSQDLSGKILDNAPRLTYSVAGEYRDALNMQGYTEWFVRLDASFKDDLNLFVAQPAQTRQSSYHLVNGRIGLESPDNWRLTLWGKNLANEDYLVEAELSETGLEKIPGLPRTYGVTLDWYF